MRWHPLTSRNKQALSYTASYEYEIVMWWSMMVLKMVSVRSQSKDYSSHSIIMVTLQLSLMNVQIMAC